MKVLFLFPVFFVLNISAFGKGGKDYFNAKNDSNYIESYYNDLIVRIYSGEKSHSLELGDLNTGYRLQYLPNGYFNMGVGFIYRYFGLSLATKIPFLQNNEFQKGETKRFGLQSYIYTDKFTVDIMTSFSKGYYLKNSFQHLNSYTKQLDYQRPDIASAEIGVSVNYIFNNAKFSYKAAFSGNDRQLKNAGSFIGGGSILSYSTKADSAFVPRGISYALFTKSRDVYKSGVLAFNANGGYAYSLVFLRSGIVTLSYIVGAGIQNDRIDGTSGNEVNNWRFSFNQTGRFGIGYRVKRYSARIGIIHSSQYTSLKYNDLGIVNGTDFIQISLAKRISLR